MSLARYLEKCAAAISEKEVVPTGIPTMRPQFRPMEHQARAVEKLFENRGRIVLAHGTGTGKTFSAIYGFEKMRNERKANRVLVLVPASLRENFARGGVEKFTTSDKQIVGSDAEKGMADYIRPDEIDPNKTYTIMSYDRFRRDPVGFMRRTGADTIILDEFHRVRNDQARIYQAVVAARPLATNFIGITGSLINNAPDEIARLLNLSEGGPPQSPKEFARRFTQTIGVAEGFQGGRKKILGLKDPAGFAMNVSPKIDYFESGDAKGRTMPKKVVRNEYVPMSPEQYHLYELALNRLGPIKEYVTRRDPNITVRDANMLFGQIMQARQISNSVAMGRGDVTVGQSAQRTPKVRAVLDATVQHLKERPDGGVVLYSNLIRGGVDVLSAGLKGAGIPHALFIGAGTEVGDGQKVTTVSRAQGVEDFKAGKKRVLVLSGAGSEGLDLPDATAFYALDGHFNPERIMQAEARTVRMGGQSARPPEQRAVDVRRFQSVVPESARPGFFGRMLGRSTPQTTDEWMYNVAGRKYRTNRQFYNVLREPTKYLRKERAFRADGTPYTKYTYARKPGMGLFGRIFGRPTPTTPPIA